MTSHPERDQGGVLVAHPSRVTGSPDHPIRLLHRGFDGLDMAFCGALRLEDIGAFEDARGRAEREFQPVLVKIGSDRIAMHVADHGAKGGFRFIGDTGPMGETWFFKKSQDRSQWNIRVSMKSLPLALYGIHAAYDKLRQTLLALGIKPGAESISRIDYAIDFLMPDTFRLQPDQFVVHSRSNVSEHDSSLSEKKVSPDDIEIHFAGRHASSVTIGKLPGRQIIVYDKLREVIRKQKLYWFDIWDLNQSDDSLRISRTELRAGKNHLQHWQIRTFADLLNQVGDLFTAAASAVRYIQAEPAIGNITRRPLHPLWCAVQQQLRIDLLDHRSGIVPGRLFAGEQDRIFSQYVEQICALLPGAIVASCNSDAGLIDRCSAVFACVLERVTTNTEQFSERVARARDRLHFTVQA